MVLGLIVHYIIANSFVPEKTQKKTSTPTQTSAYKQKQKDVSKSNKWHNHVFLMFQNQKSDTIMYFYFQNLLFLNQDNML